MLVGENKCKQRPTLPCPGNNDLVVTHQPPIFTVSIGRSTEHGDVTGSASQ